jgi:hypothetical protein
MIVRFVEMRSGVELWREERSAIYSASRSVGYNVVVQKGSRRRAEWFIAKIEPCGIDGVETAFVEPSNKLALRRNMRRAERALGLRKSVS